MNMCPLVRYILDKIWSLLQPGLHLGLCGRPLHAESFNKSCLQFLSWFWNILTSAPAGLMWWCTYTTDAMVTIAGSQLLSAVNPCHSIESPSMVDPPWNIICIEGPSEISTQSAEVRLAVSGAQPLFTLGLLMLALSLVDFLSLLLSPIPTSRFLFLSKVSFEGHIQNLQKNSYCFKIWMGCVGPILITLGMSSVWGFL